MEIVLRIFNLYLEGKSYQTIANMFNEEKILFPEKKKWTDAVVSRIINNRIYVGDIEREKLTEHEMYKDVLLKIWTMKSKDEKQSFISKFIDNATLKKNKDGSFEIEKVNFRSSFIE